MSGKTIRLVLVDGTAAGVIAAEIGNWAGKLYVAPRTQLAELRKRLEMQGSGVYALVGPDPDVAGKIKTYIGESDQIGDRLYHHDHDYNMDFFEKIVAIVNKDHNLTKTHVRFLETQLIKMARLNGSATIANDTKGSLSADLPESDEVAMQSYLDFVQLLLPILGVTFTQPMPSIAAANVAKNGALGMSGKSKTNDLSPVFVLSVPGGAVARAREVGGRFIVLGGSTARKDGVESWTAYKALRDQLLGEGKLIQNPVDLTTYVVSADIPMSSPSAAAVVIAASNTNGRQAWRTAEGESYQEWFDKRIDVVQDDAHA